MDLQLADQVAVVTGASKGIGLAVTRALVDEGAYVVAGARDPEGLDEIDRVTPLAVDLTTPDGPSLLIERAIDQHGRVDVLVNSLEAAREREGFLATSDDEFASAMETNFFAALRATRAALVQMLLQGGGAIVNVASVSAFFQPDAGAIDYGAAKAALVNVSKSLAQEFGPRGVRVNCVSPGPVGTQTAGVDADAAREAAIAGTGGLATGRFTSPEEVATLIVLLASGRTANVTGANYVIDGGLIKTT